MFLLFCVSKKGWGWKNFVEEVNLGAGLRLRADRIRWLRGYCAYVLPAIICVIFAVGLLERFKVIRL